MEVLAVSKKAILKNGDAKSSLPFVAVNLCARLRKSFTSRLLRSSSGLIVLAASALTALTSVTNSRPLIASPIAPTTTCKI